MLRADAPPTEKRTKCEVIVSSGATDTSEDRKRKGSGDLHEHARIGYLV